MTLISEIRTLRLIILTYAVGKYNTDNALFAPMFLFLFPRQSRKCIRMSASHYKANLKRQCRHIGKQREDDSDDEGAKVSKKEGKRMKRDSRKTRERERRGGGWEEG